MSHDRDREPSTAANQPATRAGPASPAPGARTRTDRLPPSKKRGGGGRATPALEGVRRTIQDLDQRAGQLADAIAGRDFYSARAVVRAIEVLRDRLAPALDAAARSGVDPDELATLNAAAAPLAARLDVLIPQAPAPLPGLGVDLVDPGADAARESAWLASLPAAASAAGLAGSTARPRIGDPFGVMNFLVGAQPLDTRESGDTIGDAVDPDAASVQPVEASGTADEPLIGLNDIKRAALSGPFVAAPRKVQDAIYGPLVSLLRKRETIRFVLDPSGGNPVDGAIADVLADLVNDPAFSMGFAEGAIIGTGRAIFDTVKGVHDAAKLAQELIVKVAMFQSRELLAKGKQEIDALIKLIEKAPGILEDFADQWNAKDSYTRGRFQGQAVAYIVTQLAILIAGSISGGPAMAGPFANVIKALGWIDNPIAGVAELAADARLSTTAVAALRAGHGMRSVEPIAEARAAGSWFGALDEAGHDVAATRRPLATADELSLEVDAATASRHLVAQEIGAIPVAIARTGDENTYYVTRADGANMQTLLVQFEGVRVREFPRGLTVHYEGRDWFFEWMPEAGAPAQATKATRAPGSALGLPASNASLVEFHGFRGLQTVNGVPWKKLPPEQRAFVERMFKVDPLLHYGHVGVSFDGGKTIYGLTPPIEGTATMTPDQIKAKVMNHEPVPGVVKNDNRTFQLAREMAREQGWDLDITVASQALDEQTKASAFGKNIELSETTGQHDMQYQWPSEKPNEQGSHYAGANARNCATYPQILGLCVPEPSGQLKDYIPFLKRWKAQSPVDLRTGGKP